MNKYLYIGPNINRIIECKRIERIKRINKINRINTFNKLINSIKYEPTLIELTRELIDKSLSNDYIRTYILLGLSPLLYISGFQIGPNKNKNKVKNKNNES